MTGNSKLPESAVDLATLKTDITSCPRSWPKLTIESKKVIDEKNKQRQVIVKEPQLGRYVEVTCKNDMAIFQSSGFQPASNTRTPAPALTQNIRRIDHGANSGQIVIRLLAVLKTVSDELQYAAVGNTGAIPVWATLTLTRVRTPVTISGLTKGTTYAFQVRSLAKAGVYSDRSDPVTFMCT